MSVTSRAAAFTHLDGIERVSEQGDGDAAAGAREDVLGVPYHLLLERALPGGVSGEVRRHAELAIRRSHPGTRRIQH